MMVRWLSLALAVYGVAAQNEFAFDDNDYVQYKTVSFNPVIIPTVSPAFG